MTPLVIDGNYGEGGGSIVRLATAFSVLKNQSVEIKNIRYNRPKPGLKHQHVIGLELLKEISNAKTSDLKEGAMELSFSPEKIHSGVYHKKIHTAGSIGLIIQILQIALARSVEKIVLNIDGGATFGKWAPSLPYLEQVTFSNLKKMGIDIKVNVIKHGFYPKGGAKVNIEIQNKGIIQGLKLDDFGEINKIYCISIASNVLKKANVADRQFSSLKKVIKDKLNLEVHRDIRYVDTLNPGSGICAWAVTDSGIVLGFDYVGEKKLKSEIIGENCAVKLIDMIKSRATVDYFQADQLIPFLYLSESPFSFITNHLSNHTKTNIWLGKQFFKRDIEVKKQNGNYRIGFNG